MRYKHLVITRFNIQISRSHEARPTKEWMQERLRLFETYCLPCMVQQTAGDFTWLLLLDEHTDEEHMTKLRRMCGNYPFIRIRPTAETNDLTALYRQIAEEERGEADWLVTTRLDNDDCVASDFVVQIQSAVREADMPYAISMPTGCQLFEKQHVMFELYCPNNHFVTLVERCNAEEPQPRTVLDVDHRELTQLPTDYICKEQMMWGEVVHGGNVLNDYTPHTRTKVVRAAHLPFAPDFSDYLHYGKNYLAKIRMHIAYRKRSVSNLISRLRQHNG